MKNKAPWNELYKCCVLCQRDTIPFYALGLDVSCYARVYSRFKCLIPYFREKNKIKKQAYKKKKQSLFAQVMSFFGRGK